MFFSAIAASFNHSLQPTLGRGLAGQVAVKHNIKRIDRLLGNGALHTELPSFDSVWRACPCR